MTPKGVKKNYNELQEEITDTDQFPHTTASNKCLRNLLLNKPFKNNNKNNCNTPKFETITSKSLLVGCLHSDATLGKTPQVWVMNRG